MRLKIYSVILGMAVFAAALPLHAEEQSGQPAASETYQRLRRLKEENPAEFQRLVQERKSQIKSKFQEYRQKNPEKFEGFRKQVAEKRMNRLERMKRENPERFQQDMQGRAQRFQNMRRENPERFQKFLDKHPRFNERMQKRDFQPGENFQQRGRLNQGAAGRNPNNDSQFISRPDFRKSQEGNPGNFQGSERRREEFAQNHPRFQNHMRERQELNAGTGASGPGQFQRASQGNQFQEMKPPQGERRPGGFKRPRGQNQGQDFNGGGGFRPSQDGPKRGGSGDGPRKRGH